MGQRHDERGGQTRIRDSLKKSQNPNLYRIKWLGIRYLAASFVAFSERNTTHNTAL